MRNFVVTLFALLCAAVLGFAQSGEQALTAGRDAYDKGDYATAIAKLTEAAKDAVSAPKANVLLKKAKDCQSKMQAANTAYNAGKYSEAKAKYEEVLAVNPNDPNAKAGVSKCDKAIADAKNAGNNGGNNNGGGSGGGGGGVGGNTPTTLSITQPTSKSFSFGASGGTATITASSNISLTASPSGLSGWCTVSQNGKNFTVKVQPNTNTSARSGSVTIKTSDGAKSEKVTIRQDAAEPEATYLRVDQPSNKSYTFPASGGTYTVKVSSNQSVSYSTYGIASWCNRSSNGKEYTLTASANTEATTRSGRMEIKTADGSCTETVYFSSKRVDVTTDASDFTVESSESWCTVYKYNGYFNVFPSTNYSSSYRYATVTVKAGTETRNVSISQDPYPSTSTSSSYNSSYSGGSVFDPTLSFGVDFTMEFGGDPVKYGLGIGGTLRLTLFDEVVMIDGGGRVGFLSDIPDSSDGQNYYYSDNSDPAVDYYLYVPVTLNLNLGGFYFGAGYQWDFGKLGNEGVLGQIGLTTGAEGIDMRLFSLFGDHFYLGFGITAFF